MKQDANKKREAQMKRKAMKLAFLVFTQEAVKCLKRCCETITINKRVLY